MCLTPPGMSWRILRPPLQESQPYGPITVPAASGTVWVPIALPSTTVSPVKTAPSWTAVASMFPQTLGSQYHGSPAWAPSHASKPHERWARGGSGHVRVVLDGSSHCSAVLSVCRYCMPNHASFVPWSSRMLYPAHPFACWVSMHPSLWTFFMGRRRVCQPCGMTSLSTRPHVSSML